MSDINAISSYVPVAVTQADISQSDSRMAIYGTERSQDIDKVSQDFEAVFLSQVMGQIFAGDELTDYFGGGVAGDIYKSYLLDQYGKSIARAGGIGIAKQVREELLKLQEISYEHTTHASQPTGKNTRPV